MSAISGYLSEIKKIKKTGAATELSYRPAIQRLLEAAAKDVNVAGLQVLHEPQRQAGNAPDFRIDAGGIIGYVECKKPGEDLDAHTRGRQVERYHALSSNIVLTDGFVWLLLRDKKVIQTAHLGSDSDDALTDLLGIFFRAQPQQIDNAKQLAAALAVRCNTLREELKTKVGADKGHLRNLYSALKMLVYRDMREDEFADALAQMTVYTLLMAKLRAPAGELVDLYTAEKHIPQSFPLLRELSGFIRRLEERLYDDIRWTADDVLACIKNINVADIIETMSGAQTAGVEDENDPFMYFYENFLASYNPALRKSRGVYYTPLPVVRFIVRAVDDLLKTQLGIASGLAEKQVTTLDFAAGTGTFVVETMRQALNGKGKAAQTAMIEQHLLKNCHGFELLIAPYAIAHLKLAQYLKNHSYEFGKSNERLKIYLTNTLEKMCGQRQMSFIPALSEEIKQSDAVKSNPILVVMGNPPYSGHSQTASSVVGKRPHKKIKGREVKDIKDTFIGELLKEYYWINGVPLGEKNTKWLQDDYVKFFRFAQWKMEDAERGIVAIITNHSFLDNPTFRGMRHSLMQAFHQLYFLDLHGNASKQEKTPAGDKDENVFDIKQGVAISLLIKDKKLPRGVFHADVYGRRKDKYDFCAGKNLTEIKWKKLKPAAPGYFFIPLNERAEKQYKKHHGINDIFITTSVGIVTARDKLTIAYNEAEIRQRVKSFAGMPAEQARQHFTLGADARDWTVERAQQDVRESGCDAKYILPIAYRPFDIRRTYYTGQDRGFLCRPRSALMSNMMRENIGLITVRQVKSGRTWQHCWVVDTLLESTCASNQTSEISYLYPLYLYQETMEGLTKDENIKPEFRRWINDYYGKKPPAEKIMAYIYAVLHSPQYRKKYADFLRLDFPRIPFVDEWNEFKRLAAIGEKLIAAHLLKNDKTAAEFQGGNAQIDRIDYDEAKHRLYVNRDSYFNGIKPEVYNFLIGGYQPLDKYLKSRKGRNLSLQDMETIAKAAAAISDTLKHIQKIESSHQTIL